jgi:5-methylcytosine-specific restriction endonuclease McrA
MGKWEKEWARRKRRELIAQLGGKCVTCGETEYEKLTFDHIDGKDWSARGKSTDQRMCRYVKEAKLDLLQILCQVCNSKKGDPRNGDEEERTAIEWEDHHVVPDALKPDEPF